MMTTHLRPILVAAALWLCLAAWPSDAVRAAEGVNLQIVVQEILAADPPEAAVIDSVSVPLAFDRRTAVRAGNFVADVTVSPRPDGAVHLAVSIYVNGPLPDMRSDEATVAAGAALVVDSLRGKGKSHYRAHFIPRRGAIDAAAAAPPLDSLGWQSVLSASAEYFVPEGMLPPLQFLPIRMALDFELETLLDSLEIKPGARIAVYLSPEEAGGYSWDSTCSCAIDPARLRVAVRHRPLDVRIDPRDLALAAAYRVWGYAPDLLAVGACGILDCADYRVRQAQTQGAYVPLDSLAQSIRFRRHNRQVAAAEAASFVTWIVNTYGLPPLRTLYERATDLSIHRAIWSVFNKTLAELEQDWLAYLKTRTFDRDEFLYYANRDKAYRRYATHLAFLEAARDAMTPADAAILRDIGIALGQMGRWNDAVAALTRMTVEYPNDPLGWKLLCEAQRAAGDDLGAGRNYQVYLQKFPADALTYLRLGDIQWDARRADSALALWRLGEAASPNRITAGELRLRVGHYYEGRRRGADSARTAFADARRLVAQATIEDPTDAAAWIITAEALLGLDSLDAALEHLRLAETLTDAAVAVGRIRLLRGFCLDRAGRRSEALAEYRSVVDADLAAPHVRLAKKHQKWAYGD
jgi:tetratricopeptide (TPR) repeat protein